MSVLEVGVGGVVRGRLPHDWRIAAKLLDTGIVEITSPDTDKFCINVDTSNLEEYSSTHEPTLDVLDGTHIEAMYNAETGVLRYDASTIPEFWIEVYVKQAMEELDVRHATDDTETLQAADLSVNGACESESVAEAVLYELGPTIIGNLLLPDLVYVGLRINRSCRDAARARIAELWPVLQPLLGAPFHFAQQDLLCEKNIHLHSRALGEVGAKVLAAAIVIGAMAKCTHLYLQENQIGDAGITALASACAGGALPQLQTLWLHENKIGDAGMQAFASACASGALPQCAYLSLEQNQIGDAGITALAQAIKPVSDGGSGAMANCTAIWLDGNPGSSEPVDKVLRGRKK
jgi:hypothetical protein